MGLAPYGEPQIPSNAFFEITNNRFDFKDSVPRQFKHSEPLAPAWKRNRKSSPHPSRRRSRTPCYNSRDGCRVCVPATICVTPAAWLSTAWLTSESSASAVSKTFTSCRRRMIAGRPSALPTMDCGA